MKKIGKKLGVRKGTLAPAILLLAAIILLPAAVTHGKAPLTVQAQDLDNAAPANQEGDTTVEGTVTSQPPGSPTYVLRIPSSIDFGILQTPAVDTDSFKDIPFQVELVSLSNLQRGSVVSVLARDGNAPAQMADPNIPFSIKKTDAETLTYSVYTGSDNPDLGMNLEDNATWYEHGYLFGSFNYQAVPGSHIKGATRLNQRQLFGKDMSSFTGDYTGQIHFYSRIANAADFN